MFIEMHMQKVIQKVSSLLEPLQIPFLIGGSVNLVLRGIDLDQQPRDIDIYIDEIGSSKIYQTLLPYQIVAPHVSHTNQYSSTLSQYIFDDLNVELVSQFRVYALSCDYQVDVSTYAAQFSEFSQFQKFQQMMLMPLAHELIFNILRERNDRILPIIERYRQSPTQFQKALDYILTHNHWSEEFLNRLHDLCVEHTR